MDQSTVCRIYYPQHTVSKSAPLLPPPPGNTPTPAPLPQTAASHVPVPAGWVPTHAPRPRPRPRRRRPRPRRRPGTPLPPPHASAPSHPEHALGISSFCSSTPHHRLPTSPVKRAAQPHTNRTPELSLPRSCCVIPPSPSPPSTRSSSGLMSDTHPHPQEPRSVSAGDSVALGQGPRTNAQNGASRRRPSPPPPRGHGIHGGARR